MGSFIYLDDFLKEHVKNGPAGCGCAVVQNDELLYIEICLRQKNGGTARAVLERELKD